LEHRYYGCESGSKTVDDEHAVKAIEDTIPFNSRLQLTMEIPFDESSNIFLEKKVFGLASVDTAVHKSQTGIKFQRGEDGRSCNDRRIDLPQH